MSDGVYNCSYQELVDVTKMVEHPKNTNNHPPEQIERLAKIIEYQGQRSPVVVDKESGFIVVGHGRLRAIKMLGWDKVAVDYQEFENEAQLFAHMTADNAIAEWATLDLAHINVEMLDLGPELDLDMLGLKDFVVEPLDKLEPQCDEDAVPEVDHAITRRGDIWLLGDHRVCCGDSTMIDDVEKLMKGEKADMVFTDPPYGISVVKNGNIGSGGDYKANDYKEIIGDNERFDSSFIKEFFDCDMILWGANYYCHDLEETNSWLVWQKIKSSLTFSDGEMAWCSIKTPLRIYEHIWAGGMRAGDKKTELKNRVHPTQKPVGLFVEIFNDIMKDGYQKVVDLFLGSGSTLIACEKTNRKCYGMELEEHYCDVIINRWQNFTGKRATLESSGQTYEELKQERDNANA